jgi:hypothetical protein
MNGGEQVAADFLYYLGAGPLALCKSITFIFTPFDMITSPGFSPAAHRPSHFAVIVMCDWPFAASPGIAGPPLRVDVTSTE